MISILHLSDLHIVQSAQWNNIRPCVLEQASRVRHLPRTEKLLVLTGDFRNFWDGDYSRAEAFLRELFRAMDIDPATGVFAVPGNHDVGNAALMNACFGRDSDWEMRQDAAVAWLKSHNSSEQRYASYLRWRLESYRPLCQFLEKLGIPCPEQGAVPHVRRWQNRLNLLLLNTTLVADGRGKDAQQLDLLAATDDALWAQTEGSLPALALGHNSFYDLDKGQRTALEAVFLRHGVCAYLCGDTHREELDRERQTIRLKSGYSDAPEIPNVVGVKGAADDGDSYSDFGLYWHHWDETAGTVTLELLSWKPEAEQSDFLPGRAHRYAMPRRERPGGGDGAGPGPRSDLREALDTLLAQVRRSHPSFRFMDGGAPDTALLPKARVRSAPGEGTWENAPLWAQIQRSWQLPENHSIVIRGAGGIGKTAALLSPEAQGVRLPAPALYLPMSELVDRQGRCLSIDDYLQRKHPAHRAALQALAEQPWQGGPGLLLLLDGFNELPQQHRCTVLTLLNDWRSSRTGVQLIAVSRPMDQLDLSRELTGEPITLELLPLERGQVCAYLQGKGVELPPAANPVWRVLIYPLFLVLYARGDRLQSCTNLGYPLAPKAAVSGGALIWNYLQRELLRRQEEGWVLSCAVACEYILPSVAFRMARQERCTVSREELRQLVSDAVQSLDPARLPKHLRTLFDQYEERYEVYPDLSGTKWLSLLIHETGLLTQCPEADRRCYTFVHQHFRDALAGMYLVGRAEAAPGLTLPDEWQISHSPEPMAYAAELMEEDTARALWQALRSQKPLSRRSLYVQMELHRHRNGGDFSALDCSGMDLREISMVQYGPGLFHRPEHTRGTRLNLSTFRGVGHDGAVTCLAVLADGTLVSGSGDHTLRLWDPNTGDCLGTLEGHTDWVKAVTALDGYKLVSGSWDRMLRVWDLTTGACRVLGGHTDSVTCLCALGEDRVVSGSDDETLRVWDLSTGESRELRGHSGPVTCLCALGDGRVVSGSGDETLRLWDLSTGESRVLRGHSDMVTAVTALADGRIVSGGKDHSLRLWNLATGESSVLQGHSGAISCITDLGDGRIVTGSWDNSLRLWNLSTGAQQQLRRYAGWVRCAARLGDGRIATGTNDNLLLIRSPDRDAPPRLLGTRALHAHCAAPAATGRWVTGQSDGTLRLWDASRCLRFLPGHGDQIRCLCVREDGSIVSGGDDGTLRILQPRTGACRVLGNHGPRVRCVTALGDGQIVSGGDDCCVRLWDPDTGENRELRGHTGWVSALSVLSDGTLVSAAFDHTLRVWNLETGESRVLRGHTQWVRCLCALADGRVVSGGDDSTLRIWSLRNGESEMLLGHSRDVTCLCALPDGRIVSGSRDNTLRLWEPDRGSSRSLEGHTGALRFVTALEGGLVLSGADDGTLRLWDVDRGLCRKCIPLSEMDVTGMDLRLADLDEDAADVLRANGARVPGQPSE